MRKIKVKELSLENFHKYGNFCDLNKEFSDNEKNSDKSIIMHRDVITQNLGVTSNPAFFLCFFKDIPMIVKKLEAHETCEEVLILVDDVIISVSPACANRPDPDSIEAFFVPKYTIIKYNRNVWHYAPIPYRNRIARALYCMPQKVNTYDESPIDLDPLDCAEIVP